MSEINSITVSVTDQQPITQASFGKPLIIGRSAKSEFLELTIGSGSSGIKWTAATAGDKYINVAYIDPAANDQTLSVARTGSGTKLSPYLITVNLATGPTGTITSTATLIKAAAEAVSNVGGGSAIVTLTLTGAGSGVVEAAAAAPVIPVVSPSSDYTEITDADDLLDPSIGYEADDEEYLMASAIFSQSPRVSTVAVYQVSAWSNVATELAELRNSGKDDWYWLLATTRVKSEILPVAAYVNSLKKVGVFATSDQTIADDAPETQDRCVYVVSENADEFPDAAWVGRCAAEDIGSISWDSKQLSGQNNSGVTMSEQTTLLSKNMNLLREMGKKVITWEGKTRSGQYIDILNGKDYIEARLIEAWHFLKINNKKVEMSSLGLGLIETTIREVMRDCGRKGIIAGVYTEADLTRSDMGDYQYTLTVPTVDDLTANDRANRTVTGIKGVARVGGGINYVDISIEMTV